MEYRRLGNTGLKLSQLSLGSWATFGHGADEAEAERIMTTAHEAGINFFDNAEAYAEGEAERMMGRILRKVAWSRDAWCVSSKVFWGGKAPTQMGLSRKHVHDACNGALQRLQTDYLDLFFCHRPDPETPIEETVRAMNELITMGKVRYWGTSEWSPAQIREAGWIADRLGLVGPAMEQPQYNLLERYNVEIGLHRLLDKGLGLTTWSPLASGILTGKYRDGIPEGSRLSRPTFAFLRPKLEAARSQAHLIGQLVALAGELNTSPAVLAIAWCTANPRVSTVILGASNQNQLRENLKAVEVCKQLTPAVLDRIDGIIGDTRAKRAIGRLAARLKGNG